jgi:photosystem II stability/assembly factor-like uncharacterized protein
MAMVALTVLAGGCRAVSEKTGVGRPWKEIALPFDADVHELFFRDENTGWAVGGGRSVNGGLVASTRGGTTWSVQTNVGRGNPEHFAFMAVYFVDSDRGWVGGGGGLILRTLDGGKTWDHQHDGSASDAVADLFFLDQNVGWAAKRNGVLWTTDGGETWTAAGGRYMDGYAIQFLDEQRLRRGAIRIFKSTDGGQLGAYVGARFRLLRPSPRLLGWSSGSAARSYTRDL